MSAGVGTDGPKKWRIVYCRSRRSARKRRCARRIPRINLVLAERLDLRTFEIGLLIKVLNAEGVVSEKTLRFIPHVLRLAAYSVGNVLYQPCRCVPTP